MTDDQFLAAFEACELSAESFHHRDHIRLAWLCVRRYPGAESERRVTGGIRRFAAHLNASAKYHETITLAWIRLVAGAAAQLREEADFQALESAFPALFDKRTLEIFYSPELLASEDARQNWAEPDRKPLTLSVFAGQAR